MPIIQHGGTASHVSVVFAFGTNDMQEAPKGNDEVGSVVSKQTRS
jgi:hypothetical protein